MHEPAKARRAALAILARAPEASVHGLDETRGERAAKLIAEGVLARTAVGDPDALARQDAASEIQPPLRRVFRSTTELSLAGGTLVEARNAAVAPTSVAVTASSPTQRGALARWTTPSFTGGV